MSLTPKSDSEWSAIVTANPVAADAVAIPGLEDALEALGSAIPHLASESVDATSAAHRARRRPVHLRRSAVIGIAAILIASGAAAAGVLGARTGEKLPARFIRAGGPGELLRAWAPNFCKVALSISKSIQYPSGYSSWRPWVIAFENEISPVTTNGPCGPPPGPHFEVTTGAERGWFAASATCAWFDDWKTSVTSGDTREASLAKSEVLGALKWPAIVAEDPHPYSTRQRGQSIFGFLLGYLRVVEGGDVARASVMLSDPVFHCAAFVPPRASHGGTDNPRIGR